MLRCPDPECKRPLPHYVLRDLLTDEEYQRWDELSLASRDAHVTISAWHVC